MFDKSGTAIAARYESGNWIEVGEVTGMGGGSELNGVKYDHVLDIEMEKQGGVVTLQVGYNDGDNPFEAAQKFVDDNELSQSYLGQVADYIRERCGTKKAGNVIDMTSSAATDADMADADVSLPAYAHLPVRGMTVFMNGEDKIEKVTAKIFELLPDLAAVDTDAILEAADVIKQSSRYHSTTITEPHMISLSRVLKSAGNDASKAFPSIDMLRLASCHPSVCTAPYAPYWGAVVDNVLDLAAGNCGSVAVCMLTFRLVCNLLKPQPLASDCALFRGARLDRCAKLAAEVVEGSDNKNVRSELAEVESGPAGGRRSGPTDHAVPEE